MKFKNKRIILFINKLYINECKLVKKYRKELYIIYQRTKFHINSLPEDIIIASKNNNITELQTKYKLMMIFQYKLIV